MENTPAFVSFVVLLESLVTGFGVVMLLLHLIRSSAPKTVAFKELFTLTAVQSVRLIGILLFVLSGILIMQRAKAVGGDTTRYILSGLMPAILVLVLTQCFWIKKLYHKKSALITLSLLLLALPSRWLLAYATSPDSTTFPDMLAIRNILLTGLLGTVVFFFLVFMIMSLNGRLKSLQ